MSVSSIVGKIYSQEVQLNNTIQDGFSSEIMHPAAVPNSAVSTTLLAGNTSLKPGFSPEMTHPASITLEERATVPKFIFCPPPLGKPNSELPLDPELRTPRERVAQPPQKPGNTCWYYAAKMISQRIGKKPAESQLYRRNIEKMISSRRKAQTEMQEQLYWQMDFAKQMAENCKSGLVTKKDAQKLLQKAPSMKQWVMKDKCCPVLEAFCKQENHFDLVSYVTDASMNARITINLDFLKRIDIPPQQYYESVFKPFIDKEWEDLNLFERDCTISSQADLSSYVLQGLRKSSWHPLQGIDSLIREIQLHGPLLVSGKIGQEFYQDGPTLLPNKVEGWPIYGWPANSPRVEKGALYHAVIVVGASSDLKRVYYRDPIDGSDPKQKDKVKTYATSFERFKENLCTLHNMQFKKKSGEPAFTEMVENGPNEYALYGNPQTSYL